MIVQMERENVRRVGEGWRVALNIEFTQSGSISFVLKLHHSPPEGTSCAYGAVRVLLSLPNLLQTEGRKSYIEEVASCNTVALFDDKIAVHLVCSWCHAPLVRWLQSLVTTNHLVSVHRVRSHKINLSGFS